jgi:CxxC motif-containing protein (DUF1111 family)
LRLDRPRGHSPSLERSDPILERCFPLLRRRVWYFQPGARACPRTRLFSSLHRSRAPSRDRCAAILLNRGGRSNAYFSSSPFRSREGSVTAVRSRPDKRRSVSCSALRVTGRGHRLSCALILARRKWCPVISIATLTREPLPPLIQSTDRCHCKAGFNDGPRPGVRWAAALVRVKLEGCTATSATACLDG